jgi:hypothetical protein
MQIGRLLSAFSQRYVHPAGGESDMVLTPQLERATRGSRGAHWDRHAACATQASEEWQALAATFVRFAWAYVSPPCHPAPARTKRTCNQPGLSASFCLRKTGLSSGIPRGMLTCRVRSEQVRRDAHTGGVRYLKEGTPERPGIKLVTAARARQLLKSWMIHRNRV